MQNGYTAFGHKDELGLARSTSSPAGLVQPNMPPCFHYPIFPSHIRDIQRYHIRRPSPRVFITTPPLVSFLPIPVLPSHFYSPPVLSLYLVLFFLPAMSSSQGRRGSLPGTGRDDKGVISRVSGSISQSPIVYHGKRAASEAATVGKKLLWSTGRAAWIAGTTFLVLVVPLIIEMDREQQMNELEMQQASLLGTSPPSMAAPAPPK
ncbi:putative Mitochondrial import receptor subunit TOM9-2 [Cocos nucifera]|uniref:Putative Mitochondrial import receptor subunit TOM9-2 n=1 Tax=Cocos nucifera TaxID=13894 RepID=A0A8K0IL02_COCNU|nr:putative Mitochondrial import receptor subunit TOM9-2 [Cocos nucifera]